MKNIIIFGFGEMGRKLVDECLDYGIQKRIVAIADNKRTCSEYREIPVIASEEISELSFDEMWISTVYHTEIRKQLSEQYGLDTDKMFFVEPVMPILEERIRIKYKKELLGEVEPTADKKELVNYMLRHPVRMYCYPFYDEYLFQNTPIYFDEEKSLYYGFYESKKMYLARRFNTEQKARAYFNAVLMEQDSRCPHCYWNHDNMQALSGVGIDVGAAEGIFALKIIEQVEHIYLAEVAAEWIEALRYTFEPYQDKVTIVQKFISDEDDEESIRLDTLFENRDIDFIKMDIEGMEYRALQGAQKLLWHNNVQLAICVYHHMDDNQQITDWLQQKGYRTNNSEGFILCQGDWELNREETDFRRGLVFANKGGKER